MLGKDSAIDGAANKRGRHKNLSFTRESLFNALDQNNRKLLAFYSF
jgi:hypothetical protein